MTLLSFQVSDRLVEIAVEGGPLTKAEIETLEDYLGIQKRIAPSERESDEQAELVGLCRPPNILAHSEPALTGVHHRSLGAIEGRLELVSLHHPYNRFNVYDLRTGRGVKCSLPSHLENAVIGALKRRVGVSGVVSYNVYGEPLSVLAEAIRVLGEEADLPPVSQMLGFIPDLTGDLSTEEHLRILRDG